MQLSWGSYNFDVNSTVIGTNSKVNRNKGNIPFSVTRSMHVRGYLAGNGPDAIIQVENALLTALSVPYQDLIFRNDQGSGSVGLSNAGSISGVVITEGPHFLDSQGPEYATLRTFEFTAEAEYSFSSPPLYLDFRETMTSSGGYPIFMFKKAINGAPQKQLVYPADTYRLVQSGSATGYLGYPPPSPPVYPSALKDGPQIVYQTPERKSPTNYQGYTVTWAYNFEDVGPLQAFPSLWPS